MTDETLSRPPLVFGPSDAPVVYFDVAMAYGFQNNVAAITLSVKQLRQTASGKPESIISNVAHLRCHLGGAKNLRSVLDNIILLAEGVPKESENALN